MKSAPTQDFVPIKEIRDGIVILKDGSMRAVLMTSSMNFALKSEEEQKSVIFQFQNFLNSLEFSIQIFIQSRRLDINPYINILDARQKEQTNDLMKIQIKEYIEFIRTFTENVNIMTKNFFVVVPYTPAKIDVLGKAKKKSRQSKTEERIANFEENRSQLEQRVSLVKGGITRTGVRAVQLGTDEVIEVYYKLFNPGDVERAIPFS